LQQQDVEGVVILDAASRVLIEAGGFTHAAGGGGARLRQTADAQTPLYRDGFGLQVYRPILPAQVVLEELEAKRPSQQIGAVIVAMSSTRTEQLKSRLLWLTVGATGLYLVFLLSLIHMSSRSIVSPIRKLSEAIRSLGEGRLETRAEVSTHVVELETLAHGINDMAAKLQQENEILRQRTDSLTEAQRIGHLGNWDWDIVDNSLTWSDEVFRIFGMEPQQQKVTYDLFLQAVHPEDREALEGHVREALEGASTYSMDHRVVQPDGSVRHVHEQGEVRRDGGGKPARMLGTVLDITAHKQAEETIRKLNEELEEKVRERTRQLEEAQEAMVRKEKLAMLGRIAGGVGHELRNPLGVMSNAVYFLQTVLTDADDDVKEYLTIIQNEIAGSERIVAYLMDAVRTKPPSPGLVGVRELVTLTLSRFTPPPSVQIRVDVPDALPPLRADAEQIHQVLRNLIINGVEAMPKGGTLDIRARAEADGQRIVISVSDSGSGIAPEVLPNLFQPLFTTKARGIGLGLVVVKNLTEGNDGTIEVQSKLGEGTTFSIVLPSELTPVETPER
jgi:PAS domain S-box-containing protein